MWHLFPYLNLLQLTVYSLGALIVCLLTWFDVPTHADVIRAGNRPELIVSTVAASLGIFTSVMGWAGILLNNRSFLAWYTFLAWITFGFLVSPGYITYKRHTFNLEGKINDQWSQQLGSSGRLRIQNKLQCCGYFNPFVEATISQVCYSRSILPGCKSPYLQFERSILKAWYIAAFVLVPLHISVMVAGLLCSNHISYRFGKGMMPEAYRLNMSTMAVIMDNYSKCVAFTFFFCRPLTIFALDTSRSNMAQKLLTGLSARQGRFYSAAHTTLLPKLLPLFNYNLITPPIPLIILPTTFWLSPTLVLSVGQYITFRRAGI